MNLQIKTINYVLFASLVVSIFGLVAMYLNYTQQSDQIEQLRGQLIEKRKSDRHFKRSIVLHPLSTSTFSRRLQSF